MYLINGSTIEDAWRNIISTTFLYGNDYVVEKGSYLGQVRRQLNSVLITIKKPWIRPLAVTLPSPYPPPTSEEKIEKYFVEYLMSKQVRANEDYTYGNFIVKQIDKCIEILNKSNGNTNQACISVGNEESINLSDPPCLRNIHFTVIDKKLQMNLYFRSHDAFAGFPENMGGLQLLKELVLDNLTFDCVDGPIIEFSSGLHIYSQYFDIVTNLVYK